MAIFSVLPSFAEVEEPSSARTYYDFTQNLDRTIPHSGTCPASAQPFTVLPTSLLCEPNAFSKICQNRSQESIQQERQFRTRSRVMDVRMGPALEAGVQMYIDQGGENVDAEAKFSFAWNHVQTELTRSQREQVDKNVKKAAEVFLSTIRKSQRLSHEQKENLSQIVQACMENPARLDVQKMNHRNASVQVSISPMVTFPDGTAKAKDPLVESLAQNCQLRLSGIEWQECAEATPECFSTLFHELGHLVNSCHYLELSLNLEDSAKAIKKQNLAEIEKEYSSHLFVPNSESTNLKEYMLTQLIQTRNRSRALFKTLKESVSCLEKASDPHVSLLNSCPNKLMNFDVSVDEIKYCGLRSTVGHPTQWFEAEADLWGAEAFSEWISSKTTEPTVARHLTLSAIEAWCIEGLEGAAPKNPFELEKAIQKSVKAELKAIGMKPTQANIKALRSTRFGAKAPRCEIQPKEKNLAPWMDPHQEWSHRIDRNHLLNSSLRKTLGCSNSETADQSSLVTCSPLQSKETPK